MSANFWILHYVTYSNTNFYTTVHLVWSDDLLSTYYYARIFIEDQEWLTKEKKIQCKIDISNPPSRDVISAWNKQLRKMIAARPDLKSIYDIALALSDGNRHIKNLESSLSRRHNLELQLQRESVTFKSKIDPKTVACCTQ
jgi:hypothetical protein